MSISASLDNPLSKTSLRFNVLIPPEELVNIDTWPYVIVSLELSTYEVSSLSVESLKLEPGIVIFL